jgi:hypothetical protein
MDTGCLINPREEDEKEETGLGLTRSVLSHPLEHP